MPDRRTFLASGLAAGAVFGPLAALARERGLDVALVNARVWTGDPRSPRSDAVGIVGDRIVATGAEAVRARTTKATRVVDLAGAFVMPAFTDNHTHFLIGSNILTQPDLLSATDRADFARRIGAAAKARPGKWILGGSWDEQRLGGELPTKAWIDAVTPDTPVAVPRTDLHAYLLNSVALKLAGITRDTPNPEGGVIERDARGEPTGVLKDNAYWHLQNVIPEPTLAENVAVVRGGIAHALSKGVAQVHCPDIDMKFFPVIREVRRLAENSGGITGARFYCFVPLANRQFMIDLVASEGRGDDWLRWGGVKALADGSLGSRTALFRADYTDAPGQRGVRTTSLEDLRTGILAADKAGLQVTTHAIGDQANDDVLDLYAAVVAANGARDRRFRIEHAQHISPPSIPRFAKQGVIASVQPYHAADDGRWAVKRIGPERLPGTYAFRSLLASGARVTFGSDWPVAPIDPLVGLHAAVTRETIDGANPAGWIPGEKVSVEQALTAYTATNAYAGFTEDRMGRVAPGFYADLAVLDADLTAIDPDMIPKARVLHTFVGGVARYSA